MKHIWTTTESRNQQNRTVERHDVTLAGRLTWRDERGAARFVSVVTRNVCATGAFVECRSPVAIPLFRLVQFQVERAEDSGGVPAVLRQGRVLSAVYRVKPATKSGEPQGLALRLLVEPQRASAVSTRVAAAATA